MNSHYFKNDQNLSNKTYNIKFYYKEYLLSLTSSAGVFSKDHLDYGTNTLLKNFVLSPNCK
ncbi:MAG TPA: class I SAM-dependent methyltransferase, partial [Bacilli bacterium]|nr:class I SAM-dependent methyltransferase [Bacilli bacterium]